MKNTLSLIVAVVVSCSIFTGCSHNFLPERAEIETYMPIQVVGIDKCKDDPSLVEVTFIGKRKNSSGKESSGENSVFVTSATGSTVFEAERKLKYDAAKKLFFGYVDYFLIGEAAAKEDFNKYFDFIIRENEIRLSPNVYIVRDGTAKELMYNTSSQDNFIADSLDSLKKGIDYISNTREVRIIELAGMLEENSAIIPALKCEDYTQDKVLLGKMPKQNILLCGYAVLNDFVLAGYIDNSYSLGYNILVDKVNTNPVTVTDKSGKLVGLEIIDTEIDIKPHFNGDKLDGVTLMGHIVCNMQEQQSRDDIFNRDNFNMLTSELSANLKVYMEKVIGFAKDKKVDFIKLGQRIEASHPYKWKKIEKDWDSIFSGLDIKVDVESHIARSYDIERPAGSERDKKESLR